MQSTHLPRSYIARWLVLGGFLTCLAVLGPTAPIRGGDSYSFTIRADWFDRANIRISPPGQEYADKYPCIWNAGNQPNQAEYDLDFPVEADYELLVLYAAQESRPMEIHLDGTKIHLGIATTTGSWQTSTAQWEKQCTVHVTAGRHTLKLLCPGSCMPHVCGLRLTTATPFPAGWKLDRAAARPKPQEAAPQVKPHIIPAIALVKANRALDQIRLEVSSLATPAAADPAANDELVGVAEAGEATDATWLAQFTCQDAADRPPETAKVLLSPTRLRAILEHTLDLIDDFRLLDRTGADLLAADRGAAATLLTGLDGLLGQPESQAKWEQVARVYLQAADLEYRVAGSNPLLDFDRLLLVKRRAENNLGLPQNWQSYSALPNNIWNNEIAVLSPPRREGGLTAVYRPDGQKFVADLDLHFDADKMLFTSVGGDNHYQVFEINTDGSGLRQVTPSLGDVDHYDACYLPDGRIVFASTACVASVACVNGSTLVANLYRMEADGRTIRQLCFDQEQNWCPTLLNNGRVMYLRWEYTDTPHAHDRVLFSMNPDGTNQAEYYGSNSYWPNSLFYARPVPGHATQFVGIVSGHHGVPRMGELVLFDPAKGRREADGAIQRIPGRGKKVEAIIADNLVDASWPKFLHPYPLSDKYFLAAAQPTAQSAWGIYLADVFDNMLLLQEEPGWVLFEPVPLRKTARPPAIPDKIDLNRKDALVYLSDIYSGGGLRGIPRGTVKKLRLVSYHYLYPGMGGPQGVVGMEGPWDIKRILGTVPVEDDGSALFRVPANTPIAVQPLDGEGKALQLMRSWFTGMPGEVISCVGCHEGQNSGPPARSNLASSKAPVEITPWRGPARGFNFQREVQPVLDKFCVGCHNGQPGANGQVVSDLRGLERITDYTSAYHHGGGDAGHFSTSYAELHRFVRRSGLESDYHLLTPMEFHADSTDLVQMLMKGHHGVELDAEAWDRLLVWIDLNAPYHGTWTEVAGVARVKGLADRRRELLRQYGSMDVDFEAITPGPKWDGPPIVPPAEPPAEPQTVQCPGWPFDAAEAKRRQDALGENRRVVELGDGIVMELVRIPAGEFVMGSADGSGYADERPPHPVRVEKPFWMGRLEVTNEQFAVFDPTHDSGVESRFGMQFGVRGFYMNGPRQPAVRLSWQHALAFCQWLGRKAGMRFSLPTEAQWEYACRAGAATPFCYGGLDADFSKHANLADKILSEFVCHPYEKGRIPLAASKYDDWIPKDARFNDGGFLSDGVGNYQPNAWGLCDMHGNVAEWTLSAYRPYPYRDDDGRNDPASPEDRVARGGSWRDRPAAATAAFRRPYRPYQPVFNVGFRVVSME